MEDKTMSRKKNKIETICTISKYEATMMQKERFNAFQCGTGAFKSKKHPNRATKKSEIRKSIREW